MEITLCAIGLYFVALYATARYTEFPKMLCCLTAGAAFLAPFATESVLR